MPDCVKTVVAEQEMTQQGVSEKKTIRKVDDLRQKQLSVTIYDVLRCKIGQTRSSLSSSKQKMYVQLDDEAAIQLFHKNSYNRKKQEGA